MIDADHPRLGSRWGSRPQILNLLPRYTSVHSTHSLNQKFWGMLSGYWRTQELI